MVRISNSVPKRGLWNSTAWRERWGSQLVRLRRTLSDEEVPLSMSQRISGRLSAQREAFSPSQWLSSLPCLSANQSKCAFMECVRCFPVFCRAVLE